MGGRAARLKARIKKNLFAIGIGWASRGEVRASGLLYTRYKVERLIISNYLILISFYRKLFQPFNASKREYNVHS